MQGLTAGEQSQPFHLKGDWSVAEMSEFTFWVFLVGFIFFFFFTKEQGKKHPQPCLLQTIIVV